MKITEMLRTSASPFPSIEIVPPMNGMRKSDLLDAIRPFMEFAPKYVNVTFHRDEYEFRQDTPGGGFTRHLVRNRISQVAVCAAVMGETGIEMVPHIICGGATKDEIESQLYNFSFLGVQNFMALRGDALTGEKRFEPIAGGYNHANELVEGIRSFEAKTGADLCIGVGAYPEKHFEAANIETDIINLKRKVDAGADYIITQMFFDNNVYYNFVDKCRAAGISVPIIPGIKPLSTARQIELLPQSFSIDIPVELTDAVQKAASKEEAYRIGTDWAIAQCKDLLAHGAPAVHFYTMGKATNIVEIIRNCF